MMTILKKINSNGNADDMNDDDNESESLTGNEASDAALAVAVKLDSA